VITMHAMARRHGMRALLCALLAAGVAPSTLRAAYAEVQAVQVAAGRDEKPAAIRALQQPFSQPARRLLPAVAPRTFTAHSSAPLYVLYCSLLR
jgi:hypothetical protein